jgi:hypothetical protein
VLPLINMTHLSSVGVAVGRARDLSWFCIALIRNIVH